MGFDADQGRSVVTAFLESLRSGDEEATLRCLAKVYREDPNGAPASHFNLDEFEIGEIETLDDALVVNALLRGREEDGQAVEQPFPIVLVEEEDGLYIHLDRSMEMLMGGDASELMEQALDSIADSMQEGVDAFDAAAEQRRVEYLEEALAKFRPKVTGVHQEEMRRSTGLPGLAFEVEIEELTTDKAVWDADRLLSRELPSVFDHLDRDERSAAVGKATRLVVRFTEDAEEWGPGWIDETLYLVVPHVPDAETFHSVISTRALSLLANPDLGHRYIQARREMGKLQNYFEDDHGIIVFCEVDWFRFTGSFDANENVWALYLLSEHGTQLLGKAFPALLDGRDDLVEALKNRVTRLSISPAFSPDERFLALEDDTIEFRVFVAEGHEDYWTVDDLVERLQMALA